MKKLLVFLFLILFVMSSGVKASLLIEEVYKGDGIAAVEVWHGEPYCNAQRGCSPVGFSTYLLYDGKEFRDTPAWFGSYMIVGYLNGSWILQRVTDKYEIVAYDGQGERVIFSKGLSGYQPVGARIVGGKLIVYIEDYPESTSLYQIFMNGTSKPLGKVENFFDGIAERGYLFVRTSPIKTQQWGVYDYYVLTDKAFSWLAGGNLWLDYFNGTLFLVEWGSVNLNKTLVEELGFNVEVSRVKGFGIPLGWNGTWYVYHDTTIALNEALLSGAPVPLYSQNGSLLGAYYVSAPKDGTAYLATPEGFVRLEGLTWYTDERVGEWPYLGGFKTPGWHVAFDSSHVYLYANGVLYIWDIKEGVKKTVPVGPNVLNLVATGKFLLLYSGNMRTSDGGTENYLYVYANNSLKDVLGKLESHFHEPPEKKVEIVKAISNATVALVYVTKPGSEPWEPGYLYLFDGESFKYIGGHLPLSWAGTWITSDWEKGELYAFNGSCLEPMNVCGDVMGSYVLGGCYNENRTLYLYSGGRLLKVKTFKEGSYLNTRALGTNAVVVYTRSRDEKGKYYKEAYLVQGTHIQKIPLFLDFDHWISIYYGDGKYLISYNIKNAPGVWRAELYEWNLTSLQQVGELNGITEILGYENGKWLLRVEGNAGSLEESLYAYHNGTLEKLLMVGGVRTRILVVDKYVVVSNESLETDPRQTVYLLEDNGLKCLGTFRIRGSVYYPENETLFIGGEGVLLDVSANRSFELNGTVNYIDSWKNGLLVQTDYAIYIYYDGKVREYIPPAEFTSRENAIPICSPKRNETNPISSSTTISNTPSGTAETHSALWVALGVLGAVTILFFIMRRK